MASSNLYELKNWNDIKGEYTDTLLLGNGASIAIHEGFGYKNLWDYGKRKKIINKKIIEINDALATKENIELLLRQFWTAEIITEKLGMSNDEILEANNDLRDSLIKMVQGIHCYYSYVMKKKKIAFEFLKRFDTVFSLNYDLILYWLILKLNAENTDHKFIDFFQSGFFNSFDVQIEKLQHPEKNYTEVFYPHGGLQFALDQNKNEKKLDISNRLKESIANIFRNENISPIFVSGGDKRTKLATIEESKYLSKVYNDYLPNKGPTLCIYGWSASEVDGHIVSKIKEGNYKKIAFSLYKPQKNIESTMEKIRSDFNFSEQKQNDFIFFDAESAGCWARRRR